MFMLNLWLETDSFSSNNNFFLRFKEQIKHDSRLREFCGKERSAKRLRKRKKIFIKELIEFLKKNTEIESILWQITWNNNEVSPWLWINEKQLKQLSLGIFWISNLKGLKTRTGAFHFTFKLLLSVSRLEGNKYGEFWGFCFSR